MKKVFDQKTFYNICDIIFNDYKLIRNLNRQYHLQRQACFYCRDYFKLEALTRDHFISKQYGTTLENNRVLACHFCNQFKDNLLLPEFLEKVKESLKNKTIGSRKHAKLSRMLITCKDLSSYFKLQCN